MHGPVRLLVAIFACLVAIVIVAFSVYSFLSTTRSQTPRVSDTNQISYETDMQNTISLEDEVIIITKEAPYFALIAKVSRDKKNDTVTQLSQVSFLNSGNWISSSIYSSSKSDGIQPDDTIKDWFINLDPQSQIKFSAKAELTMQDYLIKFASGELLNEIPTRSTDSSTSVLSTAQGTLTINDKPNQAYLAYIKSVSQTSPSEQPSNADKTTSYLWDSHDNFYYIQTVEPKETDVFSQPFRILAIKNSAGQVQRTFNLESEIKDKSYGFISSQLNTNIRFNLLNQSDIGIYFVKGTAALNAKVAPIVGIYSMIN